MRVGLTALTMTEYFRDVNELDVLLFIDNIFCFIQVGSEVYALLGRMPSVVGYQLTLLVPKWVPYQKELLLPGRVKGQIF